MELIFLLQMLCESDYGHEPAQLKVPWEAIGLDSCCRGPYRGLSASQSRSWHSAEFCLHLNLPHANSPGNPIIQVIWPL